MNAPDETPAVVQHADDAYEAIRAINHLTYQSIPAPLAYAILGNLKNVGHLLPQALTQIGSGLQRSLDEYDVYEDDGADPAESVALAVEYLTAAGERAAEVGRLLEAAQTAINRQGYHVDHPDHTDDGQHGQHGDPFDGGAE